MRSLGVNLSLMQSLEENWLFRSRNVSDYNAQDITDLAFLYMVTLHILRCEYDTASFAMSYAKRTAAHSNFKTVDRSSTDLYQFLNIVSDPTGEVSELLKDQTKNQILWHTVRLNPTMIRTFLTNIAALHYDNDDQKRLLFAIENQLHITTSNYRSMRRIAVDWDSAEVSSQMKKLTVTRMLQALRAKARRGDILPTLEKLAGHRKYEMLNVCDPETGRGCEAEPEPQPQDRGMGFLKALALGALAGGVIGHTLGKK